MEITMDDIKDYVRTKLDIILLERFNRGYYYYVESDDLEDFTITFNIVDSFREENVLKTISVSLIEVHKYKKER